MEKGVDASRLTIFVDGAARGNPGPAGVGAVVYDASDKELFRLSEYIGEATNNQAEYSALILALEEVKKLKANSLYICSDSELMVSQLNGLFKIKSPAIKSFYEQVKNLLRGYDEVIIVHVKRKESKLADKLANEAIDKYFKGKKETRKPKGVTKQEKLF